MTIPVLSMIELSTTKYLYTQFEPVSLEIELYGTLPAGDYFASLEDMASFYELEIQFENESSYIYKAPILGEGLKVTTIDSVQLSTIITSTGRIITNKPGYYRFQLKYKHGDRYVSNPLIIEVVEPATLEEQSQLEIIKQNKKSYAQYIYLEGGEHNAKGHELFKSLSNKEGVYGRVAHEYLAINYSQDYFDLKGKGKRQRLRDINLSEKYLSKIEGSPHEAKVSMKVVRNFLIHSKKGKLPNKLIKRLKRIKTSIKLGKARKSRLYKNLQQ